MADDISLIINVKGKEQLKEAAEEFARNARVSAKLAKQYDAVAAKNLRVIKEARRLKALKRDLRREVNAYEKSQGKLGISQYKYTQILKEEIRVSKEKVLTDKTLIASAQRKAKAEAQARKETERLRRAYAPATVAQKEYEKTLKEIERAYATGIIELEDYRQSMARTKREFAQFTQGVATGGNQFAKFNVEAYKTAQTFKRQFNTGMQQAGYQVGDFFVQIQSGQSALVAFGQQGSQLAGIFGPSGAILGAFLAIGTAIATIVVQAKKAEEALNSMSIGFGEATKNATSAIKNLRTENYQLTQGIDNITEAMLELATAETEAAAKANDLKNETNLLSRLGLFEFGGGFTIAGFELIKTDEKKLEFLEKQKKVLQEQLAENKKLLAQEDAKAKLNQIQTDAMILEAEVMEELRIEEQKRADLYLAKRRYVIDLITKAEEEAAEKALKLESFRIEQSNKQKRDAIATIYEAERVATTKNEDLQEFILTGRNTARLEMLRTISAAEQVEAVKQGKIQQQLDDNRQSQENRRFEITSRLRREAIASIYEAERTEILKNADLERFIIVSRNQARVQMLRIISQAEKEFAESEDKRKASITNIQDTIDALRDQVKQENILLGLTGERLKEEEIFYELLEANKQADVTLSEKKLRAIAEEIAAQKQANEVIQKGIDFARDLGDVFSDFIMNGFKDFKSFISDIGSLFKRLLAEMVANALATKIFMPITAGFTGAMMGSAAGAATGSMIGAGAGGGAFLAGVGEYAAGISSGFMGVMSGGGIGSSFANLGGLMSGSVGGAGAIGAAIPAVLAVVAVIGLLTKKTKLLDTGLRATVEGFDAAIDTFKVTQSSRLFGILKGPKVKTYEAAGAEISDPIIEVINTIQTSVVDAAKVLGIGAGLFENFTYQFELSLKGLTDDEKMQAINQELAKMGDEFASLSGHFSDVNSLLAAANERYNLQIRLLETIGDQEQALSMRRESELASVDKLNRGLLEAIHAVEDAQRAVNIAFSNLASVIEREKRTLQQGYADSVESLKSGFDSLIEGIEARLESAQRVASLSQGVYSALEGALRGRGFVSQSQFSMARETATSYLRELRGAGRIEDEQALEDALRIVAEPSQDLYEDFVDYQRDFQKQTNVIRDLESKAKLQLTTDEKTLALLQEEKNAAQIRHEESLDKLDDNLKFELEALDKQYNQLAGIKEVNLTMVQAIRAVESAINTLELKQAAAAASSGLAAAASGAIAGAASANTGGGGGLLEQYDVGSDFTRGGKTYDHIKLSGASQLLDAAKQLGIQTSGQTGAEIQQAISNTGNLAVSLDNSTRAAQFALGGYHSGGFRMVGERGPELEMTGASRIMSNNDTRKMLQNPDLVEAVKSMKQEISELRNEQRQLGINNNKYTKRTYDLYRQWDTEGLPAERT